MAHRLFLQKLQENIAVTKYLLQNVHSRYPSSVRFPIFLIFVGLIWNIRVLENKSYIHLGVIYKPCGYGKGCQMFTLLHISLIFFNGPPRGGGSKIKKTVYMVFGRLLILIIIIILEFIIYDRLIYNRINWMVTSV